MEGIAFMTPPSALSVPPAPEFASVAADPAGTVVILVGLFVASFLVGSIPWGVVISRAFFGKDIRNEGSGNIGATNAARALGKKGAAAVFLLDFGKGLFTGWLGLQCAMQFSSVEPALSSVAAALAFLGVVWGHIFCPWLGFRGGKGISAAVGNLFFLFGPVGALAELALFAVLVVVTRRVSVGSIAAAVACPFVTLAYFWGHWAAFAVVTLGVVTVFWAHRANIKRIAEGTESRIGGSK